MLCNENVWKLPSYIRLPDITEEESLPFTLRMIVTSVTKWLQNCTVKMYGGYQVTRYNLGSNMYNPSLIWLLPAGYQALKGKSMEVTKLPGYQI